MPLVFLLKLLAIPLYPLGFCLTLIITGLTLVYLRRRHGPLVIAVGTALLYVVSTQFISQLLVRSLEAPYFKPTELPANCSAIVVLGGCGMPMVPPRTFPEISEAGDRLLHAARLYKMGIAPRVITSGGIVVGSFRQEVTEGEHNALLLREIGVDSSAIVIEKKARNTADHGPNIAAILDSLHLPKKIILVTSAAHMNRSLAVFRKHGYTVFPAATDFQSNSYLIDNIMDFLPSAWSLSNATSAFYEYYGIVGYKLLGRI